MKKAFTLLLLLSVTLLGDNSVIKHKFNNAHADGPDTTVVRPSDWNDEHAFTGGTNGYLLTRDSTQTSGANWIPKLSNAIDVAAAATGGSGTSGSPWTGWDTAITWTAETEYHFKSGTYSYSTSPNFLKIGLSLIGESGTVLKFTGTGNAVLFDNDGTVGSHVYEHWTENVRMENFIIQGNANATNGLFLRGVRDSIFKHISVRDVTNAGVWTEACVTNILENFRVTHHEMPSDTFNTTPAYGIVIASRILDGGWSTTWTILNPVVEGVSSIGIWIKTSCYGHTIINGTAEENTGKGMVIDSTLNTVINTDFEQNTGTDIEINGSRNSLINVLSDDNLIIGICQATRIIGGNFHDITINSSADFATVQNVYYTGTLTDGSSDTIKFGNQATGTFLHDSYLGNVMPRWFSSSAGSTVTTDARRSSYFYWTAAQNFTLANPTNPTNGQTIVWRIEQDGTGSRIITFDTKFRVRPGQVLPVLTTTANATDYIFATYHSFDDKWDILGTPILNTANLNANQVTNAKLAQMAAHTYKGNNTGSTADTADITSTQLTADLNVFTTSLKGLAPSTAGATTTFLKADGTWGNPPGTANNPAGSDTQLQYNVGGTVFGAITGATSDGTNVTFGSGNLLATSPVFSTNMTTPVATITQGTLTSDAKAINSTVTWNNSGIVGPAWYLNVTDTSSNASALLAAFAVGGTNKLTIDKTGQIARIGTSVNDRLTIGGTQFAIIQYTSNILGQHYAIVGDTTGSDGPAQFRLASDSTQVWYSGTRTDTGSADTGLARNAAGVLEANSGTKGTLRDLKLRHLLAAGTAPSIASGFGTSPSIAGSDDAGRLTVGTGGVATTGAITFGTAYATAPACVANDEVTTLLVKATATTTTLTLTSASAWTAADTLTWLCTGY